MASDLPLPSSSLGLCPPHPPSPCLARPLLLTLPPPALCHLQLRELVKRLITAATRSGSIGALSLVGLTVSAVPLLQSYLDRTADVQSVVLLCANGPAPLLQV